MSIRTGLARAARLMNRVLPREEWYPSGARGRWLTTRAGTLLGVGFTLCFVTGMVSHLAQTPPPSFVPPSRPWWGYAVSQGVHVTSGVACVPLLAIKLWSVAPRLWKRPLLGGLRHALERGSVLVLVAAAVFELTTGLLNIAQVYVFPFFFPVVHFAVAWTAVGAIVLHLAVQWPAVREGLATRESRRVVDPERGGLTRRGVLGVGIVGATLAAVMTAGDKVAPLSPISAFAQRTRRGPQGLPVNGTALAAGISAEGRERDWRLTVVGPSGARTFDLAQLRAMPLAEVDLPIACVEGWSVLAHWRGIRLREVAALVGGGTHAWVISPDPGLYGRSEVRRAALEDPLTLLALELNGESLALDHGAPMRLIAPNRPGSQQTKWIERIEVSR